MKTPILGTAYMSQSHDLAVQNCINLYMEIVETKDAKEPGALFGCPGLDFLAAVGIGPIRPGGLHVVENILWVVSGSTVYLVTSSFQATAIGQLLTASGPVSIIDNGSQTCFSDGVALYVYSGALFQEVALPGPGFPGTLIYQDTLGVFNQLQSYSIYQSNPNDLTTWNALNYSNADGSSDYIVGLGDFHRQMVVFKEDHLEFWINAGNQGFVFQRLDGVYPDIGCAAAASIANCGEEICWLGRDRTGIQSVYVMGGYEPKRVSTHAIEYAISKYATTSDAIGWSYLQEGHRFYVLSFPSGNTTWCLDLTASAQLGYPAWHQRAAFGNGVFNIYEPNSVANFAGKIVVGSSLGPNLYSLDLNTYLDNGKTRKWLRSWRAHSKAAIKSVPYRTLEIDMDTGNAPVGTNPQLILRYTDDGYTWSAERFVSAGGSGQYSQRVRFRRLGMERRGLASDRTFELSGTDPMKVIILGGDIT